MRLYRIVEILLVFCFFYSSHCLGQELAIGDRCPEVQLVNYANDEIKSFSLSDLRSKLIILDFWGTGCTSCLKAFPKIDSLQKEFGKEIQFILVNKESPDSTRRFFAKRNKIKVPDVPMVMGDSILHTLFPHLFIPHHVWLDSNSFVNYVTEGYNATEKNIRYFLEGKYLQLSLKRDIVIEDDLLMSRIPDWKKNVEYYTALSHCIPGLDLGNSITSTNGSRDANRILLNCCSITQLFQVAFSERNRFNLEPSNTIILEVTDKMKYAIPKDADKLAEWYKERSYYYELLIPPGKSKDLFKTMQKDLQSFFDVDARVEKRKIKCLLLITKGSLDKLKTKGAKPATNFWRMSDDSVRYLKNQPFDQIVSWLSRIPIGLNLSTPFINLVKFTGNVDFEIKASIFNADHFNLPGLSKALQQYGLDLVERVYLTDVLVISDKKKKQE